MNHCRKHLSSHFLWLMVSAVMLAPYWVSAQTAPSAPADGVAVLSPKAITVEAKSAVLMDLHTGQVLVEYKKGRRIPPASFAKLLTLYIAFDTIKRGKLSLDDEVLISKKAWKTGGSKMFIEVDTKVPVRELIKGIAVVSGNDACVALAEHLHGSTDTFTNVMNETALRLGMKDSHFMNPHGLPHKQQYTTAYDMALLAKNYVREFPATLTFHSMLEYTYNGIRQYNRNKLLRKDPSVDGLKTGYIAKAGYHLLATSKRRDWRLIAVVMGAKKPTIREREVLKLLNYGYQNFELLPLFTKGQVMAEIPVWKGARDTVSLVTADSAMLTIPTEYKTSIHEERQVPNEMVAPVQQGQVIGKVIIKLNDNVIKSVPLVAQHEVNKAGFFKALSHSVYLMSRHNTRTLIVLIAIIAFAIAGYFVLMRRKRRRRPTGLRF